MVKLGEPVVIEAWNNIEAKVFTSIGYTFARISVERFVWFPLRMLSYFSLSNVIVRTVKTK